MFVVKDRKDNLGVKTGTLLLWQVLSFLCAFFACAYFTGLEAVFCALAAALTAGLILSHPSAGSCLGSVAGGLSGYAFALWNTDGGVLEAVLTNTALGDSVELSLDLRIFGAISFALLVLSCVSAVICVKKGYARTVCVAVNSFLFVLAQGGSLCFFLLRKYSFLSLELLQEKLALLVANVEAYLTLGLQGAGETAEPYSQMLSELSYSLVYSLPALGVAFCCICAFLLSFVLKRLLRKSGVIGEANEWMFMPGLASAVMYGVIFVLAFFVEAFEPDSPALYGFDLLDTVMSCAFLVPGLTAVRLLLSRRRSGGGGFGVIGIVFLVMLLPVVLPLVFSVLPMVGLVFVVSTEIRRRAQDKQNQK